MIDITYDVLEYITASRERERERERANEEILFRSGGYITY